MKSGCFVLLSADYHQLKLPYISADTRSSILCVGTFSEDFYTRKMRRQQNELKALVEERQKLLVMQEDLQRLCEVF